MGKQTTNNITALNANQFQADRKNLYAQKNPRYLYTEEDLGEGLLEAGITSSYINDQQDKLQTQPWITMLKAKWA